MVYIITNNCFNLKTLMGGRYYFSCFTDEETENQRGVK